MVVNYSDRIAYINHDIDDALRAGIISSIPEDCAAVLGSTHSKRIDTMIHDIVESSVAAGSIAMSLGIEEMTERLRQFMFENVYLGSEAKQEESKAENMIGMLFGHFTEHPEDMGKDAVKNVRQYGIKQAVTDYIAGMTDIYAVNTFKNIFIPKGWNRY
jgi:dGTPase